MQTLSGNTFVQHLQYHGKSTFTDEAKKEVGFTVDLQRVSREMHRISNVGLAAQLLTMIYFLSILALRPWKVNVSMSRRMDAFSFFSASLRGRAGCVCGSTTNQADTIRMS